MGHILIIPQLRYAYRPSTIDMQSAVFISRQGCLMYVYTSASVGCKCTHDHLSLPTQTNIHSCTLLQSIKHLFSLTSEIFAGRWVATLSALSALCVQELSPLTNVIKVYTVIAWVCATWENQSLSVHKVIMQNLQDNYETNGDSQLFTSVERNRQPLLNKRLQVAFTLIYVWHSHLS